MKYREFGSTGMVVSEVGMGCWAIGGNEYGNSYGSVAEADAVAAVRKALELGCNFFDTADVYGHGRSEEILGIALRHARDKVFIATKVGGAYMYGGAWGQMNFSEEYIRFALEQSLKRLRTGYVDVYQLHNPPLEMITAGDVFESLRKLQEEGRIRHIGVSVHTLDEGIAALKHADSIQCVFNALDPRNYEVIEAAKEKGIGIIAREPLANGLLTGKHSAADTFEGGDIRNSMPPAYREGVIEAVADMKSRIHRKDMTLAQIVLKYVLSFKSVSTVIPGAKNSVQVEENMRSSVLPDLTEEELAIFGS